MKEITDEFAVGLEGEAKRRLFTDETFRFTWGSYDISMPREVIRAIEKKIKIYRAESILDVSANYGLLLKRSLVPFKMLAWVAEDFEGVLDDPDVQYFVHNFTRYHSGDHSRILRANYNCTTLDNVCLGNLDFIKEAFCKSVEFDVRDANGNAIKGAFVYEHYPKISTDEGKKKLLQRILEADDATPFDISFRALPEDYKPRKRSKIIHRGKLLYVLDIKRIKGQREPIEESPDPSETKSPVLSLDSLIA